MTGAKDSAGAVGGHGPDDLAHHDLVTWESEHGQVQGHDDPEHEEDEDDRPRRGPAVLAALMVPTVGAVAARPGALVAAAEAAGGAIHLIAVTVVVLIVFAALSFGVVWTINTVATLVQRIRDRRGSRYGNSS